MIDARKADWCGVFCQRPLSRGPRSAQIAWPLSKAASDKADLTLEILDWNSPAGARDIPET